jgi:hypothetical protein
MEKHVDPVDPDPQHCFGLKDPDPSSLTFKMGTKEYFKQKYFSCVLILTE